LNQDFDDIDGYNGRDPAFDTLVSYNSKRAPPRPGKGGDDVQDGSNAQTGTQSGGDTQTGGNTQEGAQTGGDRPNNNPDAPPSTGPADTAGAPPGVAPLAPYADIPSGFDFKKDNRVPGENKLPQEIPPHRGLGESAEDAPLRASFQRFVNWDIQSSVNFPANSHFLLFLGQDARNLRATWKPEFNNERKHTDGLSPDDNGPLIDAEDLYKGIKTGDDSVPVPPGKDVDAPGNWMSMLQSYGVAKRAAQKGGIVRVLAEGTLDPATGQKVVYKDRLFQEGSYFTNFELNVVTSRESKVESVVAYNTLDPNGQPETIWRSGEEPLGKEPDWIAGTLPDSERTPIAPARQPSPELIDVSTTPPGGTERRPSPESQDGSEPVSDKSGDSLDMGFKFGGGEPTINLEDAV
jgi:hypothetical protein